MAWREGLLPSDFPVEEPSNFDLVLKGQTRCCGAQVYMLTWQQAHGGPTFFNAQKERINSCPMCGKLFAGDVEVTADVTKRYIPEGV